MRIAIAGHFNPLHVGHLLLLDAARKMGDEIVVIVANDHQAGLKRKPVLIPLQDRMMIMGYLEGVNKVIASIDTDSTIKNTLKLIRPDILASGCDENHPDALDEAAICHELGIKTVWNVGGEKIKSSSKILQDFKEPIKYEKGIL